MTTSTQAAAAKIPVVDFSLDGMKPGTSSWLSICDDVCHALEELGCFIAILPNKFPLEELHNSFVGALKELLDFPMDVKVRDKKGAYLSIHPPHEGLGVLNNTSEEIQKFTRHFWPNGNDLFCEGALEYAKAMAKLDQVATRMVFENYGVEKYHDAHVQSTSYHLRFNKYKNPKKTGMDVGLKPHTDNSFSSILHQNQVCGLEICTEDGDWIVFYPPPSSVIYLAGDVFQIWSNDRIRPCRHRVSLTEDEVRFSIGQFTFMKEVVSILNELVDEDHPRLYKPLDHLEFFKEVKLIDGKPDRLVQEYCRI
ncbi:hypothetical protein ACFX1R_009024 [Malus domestica]